MSALPSGENTPSGGVTVTNVVAQGEVPVLLHVGIVFEQERVRRGIEPEVLQTQSTQHQQGCQQEQRKARACNNDAFMELGEHGRGNLFIGSSVHLRFCVWARKDGEPHHSAKGTC